MIDSRTRGVCPVCLSLELYWQEQAAFTFIVWSLRLVLYSISGEYSSEQHPLQARSLLSEAPHYQRLFIPLARNEMNRMVAWIYIADYTRPKEIQRPDFFPNSWANCLAQLVVSENRYGWRAIYLIKLREILLLTFKTRKRLPKSYAAVLKSLKSSRRHLLAELNSNLQLLFRAKLC